MQVRRSKVPNAEAMKELFLSRLRDGEFTTDICADPAMPSRMWFHLQRQSDPDFDEQYRVARKLQAEAHAERSAKIALNRDEEFADSDPSTRRLATQALQWTAARLDPATWGDRTTLAGDHEAPVLIQTQKENAVRSMTYEERKSLEAMVKAALARQRAGTVTIEHDDGGGDDDPG